MDEERLSPASDDPKERGLYRAFRIGLMIKCVDGALQLLGGFILIFIKPATISHLLIVLTQQELLGDPDDFVATHLYELAQHLSLDTKLFGVFYLIAHGLVKLFIAITVLRDKHWAYKPSVIVMCTLVTYQIYRIAHTHSLLLTALTLFDVLVTYLIWHEYRYHVKRQRTLRES